MMHVVIELLTEACIAKISATKMWCKMYFMIFILLLLWNTPRKVQSWNKIMQ